MKQQFVSLDSRPVAVALWAARRASNKHIGAALPTEKRLQQTHCANGKYPSAPLHLAIAILIACFAQPGSAITLETVLQTSLERNPDIQAAKSGLEQAAGKRLVFRSVAWPDAELGVPAGVQMGHRAGESGVKGFAVLRGALTQT